jgi:hypothetical protein
MVILFIEHFSAMTKHCLNLCNSGDLAGIMEHFRLYPEKLNNVSRICFDI